MNIQKFTSKVFGSLTVFLETDTQEPWFLGTEVASYLGYTNVWDAIARHVDPEDIRKYSYKECPKELRSKIWGPSDFMAKVLVNESGLYALAFSSKLPAAKAFRSWVTHEVLPSIRKNGGYILGQEDLEAEEREKLVGEIKRLSEKTAYLQKRRHALRREIGTLKQQKQELKQQKARLCTESSIQMDYYIRLIQECSDLMDQIQKIRNVQHVRNIPKPTKESEYERSRKDIYTVDAEGFIVVKRDF